MGKSYMSVQTLSVDKIIVICGCIWAVAIIIAYNKKEARCNIWKKRTMN